MTRSTRFQPLPADRLTRVDGWAMIARSMGYAYRPSTVASIREVLCIARESGRSVVPRGSGFSYGDASLNGENVVLDVRRMNRVLDWDPERGIARVEPGLTVGQLWRHVLEDGWWPAVVPGTMLPTAGGCASTNVHGKNHWKAGTFGDHVRSLDLLLASGDLLVCSREADPELFRAVIGGLGLLGVVVGLTLQLAPIQSGLLRIDEHVAGSLDEMVQTFERERDTADELVGWIDGFARGRALGRGLVQVARAVTDDPEPARTLQPAFQDVPDELGGIVPRSLLWRAMKLGVQIPGFRVLNALRFAAGARRAGSSHLVPHARFHFMLDYVPNFKRAFYPAGLAQFQVFVPACQAPAVFTALLEESQGAGLVPTLAVLKLHRTDSFLLSYGVDGYSLALDFHVTDSNAAAVTALLDRCTREIVLPQGGRFYPAKDLMLDRAGMLASLGPDAVERFLAMKQKLDPQGIFQSNLYRRTLME